MTNRKRLSASVDSDLIESGHNAVAEGRAANLSAWVNDALRMKTEHDERLRALNDFIAAYEAEHGVITEDEIREVTRATRAKATIVRGTSPKQRRSRNKGQGAA